MMTTLVKDNRFLLIVRGDDGGYAEQELTQEQAEYLVQIAGDALKYHRERERERLGLKRKEG